MEQFHGKCAFCESRVGVRGPSDLEQFRPKGGAVGLSGDRFPDHHWWLALYRENLHPACAACNRTKGIRFPIKDAGGEIRGVSRPLPTVTVKGGKAPVKTLADRNSVGAIVKDQQIHKN